MGTSDRCRSAGGGVSLLARASRSMLREGIHSCRITIRAEAFFLCEGWFQVGGYWCCRHCLFTSGSPGVLVGILDAEERKGGFHIDVVLWNLKSGRGCKRRARGWVITTEDRRVRSRAMSTMLLLENGRTISFFLKNKPRTNKPHKFDSNPPIAREPGLFLSITTNQSAPRSRNIAPEIRYGRLFSIELLLETNLFQGCSFR